MTWRDDLLEASLNGVTFLYRRVSSRGGRRTIPFEYPGAEDPFVEDIGRSAKKFQVDAFLLGDFYNVSRNDLIAVLETAGDLTFVHPYQGLFTVKLVGDYEIIEDDQLGRQAQIRFTLHESGLAFPLIAVDTSVNVANLAAAALESLETNTRFDLLGAIQDVLNSVAGAIQDVNSTLRAVNGKIGATLGALDNITAAINDFEKQLTTLLNTPQVLMNKINGLKTALVGLVKNFIPPPTPLGVRPIIIPAAAALIDALETVTAQTLVPSVIPTNTPQGQQEALAIDELNLTNKGGMLAAVADGIVTVDLESADDAADIQALLVEQFDSILGTADLDPEIYESFAALKAAVVEHLTVQQQNLPLLADFTPQYTQPALLIAYQLYGDATRDDELIQRNRIRHPGFVPGGAAIEVVSPGD